MLFSLYPEQFNSEGVPLGLILILATYIRGYFPVRVSSAPVLTEAVQTNLREDDEFCKFNFLIDLSSIAILSKETWKNCFEHQVSISRPALLCSALLPPS